MGPTVLFTEHLGPGRIPRRPHLATLSLSDLTALETVGRSPR